MNLGRLLLQIENDHKILAAPLYKEMESISLLTKFQTSLATCFDEQSMAEVTVWDF